MAKEEKQLLLIDLCARLPYGFTVHRYSDNRNITFEKNELDEFSHFLEYSEGKEFKPYLRPMSSMTEEEVKEFYDIECMDAKVGYIKPTWNWHFTINGIDWLNKNHFDYHGLIPMGLALEAKEGMYKF